jgi:glycosyltransferase involved in cell wall biosynthesis
LIGHQSIPSPDFDALLAQLSFEIRSYIFISNAVTEDELLLFYRAALLFVYPSKAEGFGIPPLEAAASPTPVVCSNGSAMQEFDFFGPGHIDPEDYDDMQDRYGANAGRCPRLRKVKRYRHNDQPTLFLG